MGRSDGDKAELLSGGGGDGGDVGRRGMGEVEVLIPVPTSNGPMGRIEVAMTGTAGPTDGLLPPRLTGAKLFCEGGRGTSRREGNVLLLTERQRRSGRHRSGGRTRGRMRRPPHMTEVGTGGVVQRRRIQQTTTTGHRWRGRDGGRDRTQTKDRGRKGRFNGRRVKTCHGGQGKVEGEGR